MRSSIPALVVVPYLDKGKSLVRRLRKWWMEVLEVGILRVNQQRAVSGNGVRLQLAVGIVDGESRRIQVGDGFRWVGSLRAMIL